MHTIIVAVLVSMHVLIWGPEVEQVEKIEPYEMLAIIHVESTGSEDARRSGSRYYGLLQISDAYMEDALVHKGKPVKPASILMGEGTKSIQIFHWYMQRYSFLHDWDAEKVAILHKSGPTAFRRILNRVEDQGMSFETSVCQDRTPTICEYLRRFRAYRSVYQTEFNTYALSPEG